MSEDEDGNLMNEIVEAEEPFPIFVDDVRYECFELHHAERLEHVEVPIVAITVKGHVAFGSGRKLVICYQFGGSHHRMFITVDECKPVEEGKSMIAGFLNRWNTNYSPH